MSTEPKRKRTRSTKSNTAELEAKIAELEARLANLSSQVQPSVARPAETRESPKPQARPPPPPPKPAGASRGTLPAGFKAPPPPPPPKPEYTPSTSAPEPGEVAPAYATISSTEYTGNRYFATRKRLSYHPPNKQFTGSASTTTTRTAPPPPPEPRPEPKVSQTKGTLPAGTKHDEKKSMWRSKGAEYENYVSEETRKAPPSPQERPAPPPPRPAASGPTHGTLPAGMKPAPKPEPKPTPKPDVVSSEIPAAVGEVAPAYATISSTEYTGNRYFATRKRLSYHPPNKQFTGSGTTTATAQAAEPPKPKVRRGTLPAGFK